LNQKYTIYLEVVILNKIFAIGILGILCLSIFLAVAPMVSALSPSDDWPMYHNDLGHTGYTTSNGPTTNALLWSYTTVQYGYIEYSAPAVANGNVYFGAMDDNFYCVNALTGAKVWNFSMSSLAQSSPSVANGYVYFGSEDGNLYCLNALTGAQVWNSTSSSIEAGSFESDPAVANGYVYYGCLYTDSIGNRYNNLTCLNAATGAYVWSFTVAGEDNWVGSPALANGYVYFGDEAENFYCLNASTGAEVWNIPGNGNTETFTPAVANGYVYYSGVFDGTLHCCNASTGTLVWNYTTGVFNYTNDEVIYSCPAVANGNVYFGSENKNFYCLNAQTGAFVWKYTANAYVFTGVVSANDYVYFGSNDKNIYCLNAQTGALVWKYATGYSLVASPAIANGILYANAEDGKLYAFGVQGTTTTTPTLTLTVSASSATTGQQLTLSGTISPSTSGNVVLTVSINGSASQQIANPTLSNNAYSYQYSVQGPGTYVFQASFAGNSQLNPAQSPTYTVNVGQTTTIVGIDYLQYLWYIIIIIVIIIVIVLLIAASRRRRKEPAK
jgi:outer membrane protein assembly factor BamB